MHDHQGIIGRFVWGVALGLAASFAAAGAFAQEGAAPPAAPPPAASAPAAPETPAAPPTLEEKGRYLATAGDCISCHTRPGGEPFSGGLALKTQFGTLYSPNITPDKETGIGNWTEEQFARAMRSGVDDDGDQLYPVFPYTAYTKVTDDDVHAIFAYLKSLKPVSYTPPKDDMKFPYSIRALLLGWKKLYFHEGRYTPDASQSAEWNRGAYLVQGLAHCGTCHTPRNSLGGEDMNMAFTGGTYIDEIRDVVEDQQITPQEGMFRPWSSVNLTSAPSGIGNWSLDEIVQYLKTGHTNYAGAFGPMSEVINNSTKYLTDADLHAMAVYLKSLPAKTPPADKIPDDKIKAGEIVYTTRCGDCHLPTGLGIAPGPNVDPTKVSPPLVGNAIVQAPDPASLINVILYGAHEANLGQSSWPKMPGFQNEVGFDDDQIAALCDYLRASWGNQGGPVTAAQVTKQR
jgi:mono/diheme cytochrome c family protein